MNGLWIWNYGDFEIYHANKVITRRENEGVYMPVFWSMSGIEINVHFKKEFECKKNGYMRFFSKGKSCITIDKKLFPSEIEIELEAGKHSVDICVTNTSGLPCAFVESNICPSDGSWYTENTKCERQSVGCRPEYNTQNSNPEKFIFSYKHINPISIEKVNGGILFDFGKELFGYLLVKTDNTKNILSIFYGESREEALDTESSIIFEEVSGRKSYKLIQRAFRYIFVLGGSHISVQADYEYLPLEYKGSFRCDNEMINRIYDCCAYTLHLNSREMFLDGIKRDRWIWSGDAYQTYKFSNYLFFDKDIVQRTILALRGSDTLKEHINTIADYSLYWIISLWDYYMTFKDLEFIRYIYPKAVSLMEFIKSRTDNDGFIVKHYKDWIFIDWSSIDKEGACCAEQMLYIEANRAMAKLSDILDIPQAEYFNTAAELCKKVNKFFWNDEKGGFIDSFASGKNHISRHPNIFAVLYDIATEYQQKRIEKDVLLNENITKITTPYFEGFELDVMAKLGHFDYIEKMLDNYWGGMLRLGATTVWEEYNPDAQGEEHYKMYKQKYGKSLCHAWGASPIYLLGRYYLGVYPTSPAYDTFNVKPNIGGFGSFTGTVPINGGLVRVEMTKKSLSVTATKDGGTLIFGGKEYTLFANQPICLGL